MPQFTTAMTIYLASRCCSDHFFRCHSPNHMCIAHSSQLNYLVIPSSHYPSVLIQTFMSLPVPSAAHFDPYNFCCADPLFLDCTALFTALSAPTMPMGQSWPPSHIHEGLLLNLPLSSAQCSVLQLCQWVNLDHLPISMKASYWTFPYPGMPPTWIFHSKGRPPSGPSII